MGLSIDVILPYLAVSSMVCAPLAGWMADRRGRPRVLWFGFGAVLGIVAIVLLLAAPPRYCPRCGAMLPGFSRRCDACRTAASQQLRSGPEVAAAPVRAARSHYEPAPTTARPRRSTRAGQVAAGTSVVDRPITRVAPNRPRRDAAPIPFPIDASNGDGFDTPHIAARPAGPVAPPGPEQEPEVRMLATAVYFGGASPLVPGSRYGLGSLGEDLLVLGPVDQSPRQVRLRWPIRETDGTFVGDRLVITRSGRRQRTMAFTALAGDRVALESLLGGHLAPGAAS